MKKRKILREIFSYAKHLGIGIIVAVIINSTVLANAVVISGSMEGTIMTDSRVIGLRVAYLFNEPQRFDIILFEDPNKVSEIPLIKRIIGLPGETVEIINGKVYINNSDAALDDSFIKEDARGDYGPFIVPENSYFVLGDNRNFSFDSKDWRNAFVSKDMIKGKLYVSYFPSPKILG